ncbi:MAG TPA: YqeG family HAD IIIA-type phosphatase, partial [Firmicutes bacterium]|nr:YqeG family HAD IIIA-type phosphatase [Bacillota bacterium]
KSQGKKVIFTDLDNTLVGPTVSKPTPQILEFFKKATSLGFEIRIVSNNKKERVALFSQDLEVTAHHRALKPLTLKFRRILSNYNKAECVMIGDQLMTDVLVAKRLGLYTILVEPVHLQTDESSTKFNRKLERYVVSQLKKRNLPIPSYLNK